MNNTIHPYYISKAQDILAKLHFDADADPTQLAAWAQDAEKGTFAYATSDGTIVGHGRYTTTSGVTVGYADLETSQRYGMVANEAGFARTQIGHALGRPVVLVKASQFTGRATHRI